MMSRLSEELNEQIGHAESLYHRLVLVVGMEGTGKTTALREISAYIGAPLVNVGLELSHRLLELTEGQRPMQVPPLLKRMVTESAGKVVLLDNIEILFDTALHQEPLRLLKGLSRSRTVVAAWNGWIQNDRLHYAVPGHSEYRRCPVDGVLVATAEDAG